MVKQQVTLNPAAIDPAGPFQTYIKGDASLEPSGSGLRFVNTDTTTQRYSNAQIDDYQGLLRREFPWRPPLQMQVTARFSHPDGTLSGTAGFGFWNDPFLMTGLRWPDLPRALWFFYGSPPSNMKLDIDTPGFGWKAAMIDAIHWPFFLLAPLAPLAVPLMNIKALYRRCWPLAQRAIKVQEALVPLSMTEWHTYELCWLPDSVRFTVDENLILAAPISPGGPLGLVVWLDNQYMVITPWGRFKSGLLAEPGRQWMEIRQLTITAD